MGEIRNESVYNVWVAAGIAQWYSAGFLSRQGLGILLLTTTSRPAPGPTQHVSNGYQVLFPWE